MYEDKELWYAVFDDEEYDEFPVEPSTDQSHEGPFGQTITTYRLAEASAVEGTGYLAVNSRGSASLGGDFRVIAKTRRGAFAAYTHESDQRMD